LPARRKDSLQLTRAGHPPRRARPRFINLRRRGNDGFLPLRSAILAPRAFFPTLPLPPCGFAIRALPPLPVLRSSHPLPFLMAPPQPLTILDSYAWERSTVTRLALGELVTAGQLAANEDGRPAEWIVPPAGDRAPNPPEGYVVSFVRFHERGFNTPASRFMRALCHYYGVELHNFTPNAISQAPRSWAFVRGIWGSQSTGSSGCTSSARSSSRSPRRSRGPAARCAPAGCHSPCGCSSRTTTSPAP
jgi:hypothetical protein